MTNLPYLVIIPSFLMNFETSIEPPVPNPINPDWLDEPETGEEEE